MHGLASIMNIAVQCYTWKERNDRISRDMHHSVKAYMRLIVSDTIFWTWIPSVEGRLKISEEEALGDNEADSANGGGHTRSLEDRIARLCLPHMAGPLSQASVEWLFTCFFFFFHCMFLWLLYVVFLLRLVVMPQSTISTLCFMWNIVVFQLINVIKGSFVVRSKNFNQKKNADDQV